MQRLAWSGLAAVALVAGIVGALTAGRAAQRLVPAQQVRASTQVSVNGVASADGSQRRSVAGIVRDRLGTPIANAEVGSSDWTLGRARTDAAGRFEISGIQTGRIALYALADGLAPARVDGVPAGSRDIVLVAQPPSTIGGPLRIPAGARVLVSLCRTGNAMAEICVARRLFSSHSPRYELERLAPGDYFLVAELEGPATAAIRRDALRHPVAIPLASSIEGPPLAWP